MVCLSRPCDFNFFKGCLPQILSGPFLNTLTQIIVQAKPMSSVWNLHTLDVWVWIKFVWLDHTITQLNKTKGEMVRGVGDWTRLKILLGFFYRNGGLGKMNDFDHSAFSWC